MFVLGVATALSLSAGCTSGNPSASGSDAADVRAPLAASEPLLPVALPDLSPLAESVQTQLRDRHAQLTRTLETQSATAADRAAAYGALGRLLMASAFTDEAVSCFAHAAALAGGETRWPYYLGQAYLKKGDRPRAAAAFERASKLAPGELPPRVLLGETYLDDGRPDAAQSAFQGALSLQPQSAAALFGAGRAALAKQSYAEAAQYLERALANDSRASAIHYPLAMAYRALGDRERAEAHLRQRGSAFPDLPDPFAPQDAPLLESAVAYETRGVQALRNADFPSATAAFRKGLALEPDDPSLRYWLGATLFASGDAAGGERELQAVLRRAPGYAKAHFSLGVIFEGSGRRPAAIEQFRAAAANDPKMPEARLRLAEALRASGQVRESIAQYEAAVSLDPGVAEAWIGGAHALVDLGLSGQAADWLVRARRVHPARPELAELQARLPSSRR